MRDEAQHNHLENCFVGVDKLARNLQLQLVASQNIYIAYSGGMDSHVLLHLCASNEQLQNKLIAVYINHGLQTEAESWGRHCQQVCEKLDVKFLDLHVNAQAAPGESPEEAARYARYAALKPLLDENDVLILAQHAEDQLETVLLQLFRGSGLGGLSGMPGRMAFGKGHLLRPLLDVPKAQIVDYAQTHTLNWIEDPSNAQSKFDRNFLRNEILPLLKQRWPSLATTVARSASHCATAQDTLSGLSAELFNTVINQDNTINLAIFKGYPENQQALMLRQWFQHLGLKMPSTDVVQRILGEVVSAKEQANPLLATQGHEVRRYRDKLYCLIPREDNPLTPVIWPTGQSILKLNDDLAYELVPSTTGIAVERWQQAKVFVKFRTGGETLRLPGRAGSHCLKKLYQEVGIPPWQRASTPLIYLDDELAAVGELWIADAFYGDSDMGCFRLLQRSSSIKGHDEEVIVD